MASAHMGEYVEFSAKTKSEAITKACIELGVSSDQLDIIVITEGSNGFFGIGSKPAIIRVRRIQEDNLDDSIKEIVETVTVESIRQEETKTKAPKKKATPEKKPAQKVSVDKINLEKKPVEKKPAEKKVTEKKQEEKKPELQKDEVKVTAVDEKAGMEESDKEPVNISPDNGSEEKSDAKRSRNRSRNSKRKNRGENHEKEKEPVSSDSVVEEVAKKAEKPVRPVRILTDPVQIAEMENRAVVFLRDVFACMDLGEVEITAKYNSEDGSMDVDFEGEDMGVLIGKRGQTLDSLQYLTSLVVNKGSDDYIRVKLDTEDYRRRRKETLENLARGIAYKVKKTRRPVVLEPMNPYERRIIHSSLQDNKFVETISEGEEPYRHVVVKLKKN